MLERLCWRPWPPPGWETVIEFIRWLAVNPQEPSSDDWRRLPGSMKPPREHVRLSGVEMICCE